jgi:hypothetical protein
MDNVQKHNTFNNIPSSQTFRSYLNLFPSQMKYDKEHTHFGTLERAGPSCVPFGIIWDWQSSEKQQPYVKTFTTCYKFSTKFCYLCIHVFVISLWTVLYYTRFEVFTANASKEIWCNQLRHYWTKSHGFRDLFCIHHQGRCEEWPYVVYIYSYIYIYMSVRCFILLAH